MLCTPLHCGAFPFLRKAWGGLSKIVLQAVPWEVLAGLVRSESAKHNDAVHDEGDMEALKLNYDMLEKKQEFIALKAAVPDLVATWDDHDFGRNDKGASYRHSAESRQLFLDFWRKDAGGAAGRAAPGVHEARILEAANGKRVQLIVLDTRTWRSELRRSIDAADALKTMGRAHNDNEQDGERLPPECLRVDGTQDEYCQLLPTAQPGGAPDAVDTGEALLGAEQWAFVEEALLEPADVRIVCSSIGYSATYHGMEAWALFPRERKRLADAIAAAGADHTLVISGDVHYAEVSVLGSEGPDGGWFPVGHSDRVEDGDKEEDECAPEMFPLYDLTASALNWEWYLPVQPNSARVGGPDAFHSMGNFGMIDIDWGADGAADADDGRLTFRAIDPEGVEQLRHELWLRELRPTRKCGAAVAGGAAGDVAVGEESDDNETRQEL